MEDDQCVSLKDVCKLLATLCTAQRTTTLQLHSIRIDLARSRMREENADEKYEKTPAYRAADLADMSARDRGILLAKEGGVTCNLTKYDSVWGANVDEMSKYYVRAFESAVEEYTRVLSDTASSAPSLVQNMRHLESGTAYLTMFRERARKHAKRQAKAEEESCD